MTKRHCRNDHFCTLKVHLSRRWPWGKDSSVPSAPHSRCTHLSVTQLLNKCTCFYSSWDGTCNPRCLPGLDSPVDSHFLGWGLVRTLRALETLLGLVVLKKKLLLSSLCNLSVCAFFDSLDIQDLMCSFCSVGNPFVIAVYALKNEHNQVWGWEGSREGILIFQLCTF